MKKISVLTGMAWDGRQIFAIPGTRRLRQGLMYLAAIAVVTMLLLSVSSPAQASFELFSTHCGRCHNNIVATVRLTFNAAGKPEIIAAAIAKGMNASGTPAEHASIAAYLDSVKPSITLAPVAHNSPGKVITLGDITVVSDGGTFSSIGNIGSVSAPTKGTVLYDFAGGFSTPSTVTYKPFPGQSGTDTWTYQGTGAGLATTVRTASVVIAASAGVAELNFQGLWWKSPAESESGWGINFAHQGDVIFATWFTYDATGKALWLSMTANKTADRVYAGTFFQTRGPAFNAVPFSPAGVTATPVGSGTLTFSDANNGSFAYTVNGISQTKPITRQVFGTLPVCTFGAEANLTFATNYQDLWWAAPAGAESGWGVNFTHQGDTIFATWFTYDLDGTPLWLSATASKSGTGTASAITYNGTLYRTTGPAFSAVPFLPANVGLNQVGTLTLTFLTGNEATFAYTVNGVTQSKSIVRQVFRAPGTVCR